MVQVTPEFSVRLMDETFQKENDTIQDIQKEMVKYFLGRSGKLAQVGITGDPPPPPTSGPVYSLARRFVFAANEDRISAAVLRRRA